MVALSTRAPLGQSVNRASAEERAARVLRSWWSASHPPASLPSAVLANLHYTARSEAVTASVLGSDGRPLAFLKLYLSADALDAACRGYALCRATAGSWGPVRVPDLLYIAPAEQAVVQEYIPGLPLATELRWRYLALPRSLLSVADDLGRWLAGLHGAERAGGRVDAALEYHVQRTLGYLEKGAAVLRGRCTTRAQRLVAALAADVVARPPCMRPCHGDFGVYNVLMAGGRPHVIDFTSPSSDFPEMDLVRFGHSLWMSFGCFPLSAPAQRALWSAFVVGYGNHALAATHRQAWELVELELLAETVALHARFTADRYLRRAWKKHLLTQSIKRIERWVDDRIRVYGL